MGNDRWDTEDSKWPGNNSPKPRTCSYCGCAHPEDLINLLKSGWEMYLSDKKYKAYAQPKTNPHSLVPPVKFYAMHGTDDQIAELNKLLHAQ